MVEIGFELEDLPYGSEPLSLDVPDFNGCTSCFATSFYECKKIQEISLRKKRLLRYILNQFKPHIYVIEWAAGRYDCGCRYQLGIRGYEEDGIVDMDFDDGSIIPLFYITKEMVVQQWEGKKWEKKVVEN
ncbi:hypothetical protein NQ318_023082 [Aromia moschata]|uniref:FBA domain-containing protein n=1 Tax=Aromia moschata TaxID=1265417 RepID=A0AAV8XK87_9CUCU|nr:hypothetical protein NQ318_023082 [Aromia moschata]